MCRRIEPPDLLGNFLQRRIRHVLAIDLSFLGHPKKHASAIAVEKAAQRLHASLEIAGRFLELQPVGLALGNKLP